MDVGWLIISKLVEADGLTLATKLAFFKTIHPSPPGYNRATTIQPECNRMKNLARICFNKLVFCQTYKGIG
ncbi:MAG: hypothetical protein BGO78_11675 [Chloroflexi bacterium 44-23]|nr:MAG: hypothetical protein BGO78_11675 [Chloroflexi bacterium 44-23]